MSFGLSKTGGSARVHRSVDGRGGPLQNVFARSRSRFAQGIAALLCRLRTEYDSRVRAQFPISGAPAACMLKDVVGGSLLDHIVRGAIVDSV